MRAVTSADGTAIAFDQLGAGPPLIMIVARSTRVRPAVRSLQRCRCGSRSSTTTGGVAATALTRRRTRWSAKCEDLDALIAEAGGWSTVFGYSSGANLALKAAANGLAITKLALYEPPFVVDGSRPRLPADLPEQLAQLISAGRRGDAVELYQTKAIGMPEEVVAQMRHARFRPALEAIAHTLVYDATIIGDLTLPTELIASIATQTLVIDGENSPPVMRNAARAVADALPNGRARTLPDQTHDSCPDATAAALEEFLVS